MHELSIAMSIVEMAGQEAERRQNARVLAVHLRVGALSGIVPEALASAFEMAREGTCLTDARLQIEQVPVSVFCTVCQKEEAAVSIQEIACSVCGTASAQVVRGRELEICAMEIEDEG